MNTIDFKTKTEILAMANPTKEGYWVIGYDIGYSGVKFMSPNKVGVFPFYARRIPENQITLREARETDIYYRDEDGTWVVGELAYEDVVSSDVVESENELFGRNRFSSPMYKVLSRTGLGISLMANEFGNPKDKKIVVQTGLPPKYEKTDTKPLKQSLAGRHVFQVRIGKGDWQKFDFTFTVDDIRVMPQPLGSMISASIGRDGKQTSEAKKYFASNVVIFDPGCGTLDDYTIKKGRVVGFDTHPEFGMHEVFARTCADIYGAYDVEIQVPELQNYLEKGTVYVMDTSGPKPKRVEMSFENILYENCRKVCNEAIDKMNQLHKYFGDTNYIIATGGTYDAWKDIFNDAFSEMDGLVIVPGNVNVPELSNIYSNVRGYYFYLLNALK